MQQQVCPRCDANNLCSAADKDFEDKDKTSSNASSCWCMKVGLNDAQRERAAEFGKGESCLCQSCLNEIKNGL